MIQIQDDFLIHINGASFYFPVMYIHIRRNLRFSINNATLNFRFSRAKRYELRENERGIFPSPYEFSKILENTIRITSFHKIFATFPANRVTNYAKMREF